MSTVSTVERGPWPGQFRDTKFLGLTKKGCLFDTAATKADAQKKLQRGATTPSDSTDAEGVVQETLSDQQTDVALPSVADN